MINNEETNMRISDEEERAIYNELMNNALLRELMQAIIDANMTSEQVKRLTIVAHANKGKHVESFENVLSSMKEYILQG
ncbi:MAG: hypothetical protein LKJ83_03920 [Eubacteriaceae bacterium]|jgi:hypothetical protein|nr:hypothetical protein [Eubacteriaceae bacterium]